MIDGRGRAKITDFGLASLAEGIEGEEIRSGTPQYMSPEQLLVVTLVGYPTLGLLNQQAFWAAHVEFEKPPEAPAVEARDVLAQAGHEDLPADDYHWFAIDPDYLQWEELRRVKPHEILDVEPISTVMPSESLATILPPLCPGWPPLPSHPTGGSCSFGWFRRGEAIREPPPHIWTGNLSSS